MSHMVDPKKICEIFKNSLDTLTWSCFA